MRTKFDSECTGHLVLSESEYEVLPKEAKKKVSGYAKECYARNGEHGFTFYGKNSMEMAIEICRYHHLTLEPHRFQMQEVAP